MKAVVCKGYGGPEVLRLEEVATPTPKADEVLVRIHATTVTSADWRVRSLTVPKGFRLPMRLAFGWKKPRNPILGTELAGTVEAIGADVSRFQVGDPVFGLTGARMGCHAEYRCMPEKGPLARKPDNLGDAEAAALCFGGTTALDLFRRAKLQRGERILINGASGGVGTAAVQIARHLGADVAGVCSAANVALVESLGATRVIDYTQEDFTRTGETYDVIMDTVGNAAYPRSRHALAERGRLLAVVADLPQMMQAPWVSMKGRHRVIAVPAQERAEDVERLAQLAEAGHYRPVIDRTYRLEEIAEAHRYVGTGRKKGNVSIRVAKEP